RGGKDHPGAEQIAHLLDRIGSAQLRRRQPVGEAEAEHAEDAQRAERHRDPAADFTFADTEIRFGTLVAHRPACPGYCPPAESSASRKLSRADVRRPWIKVLCY